MRLMPYFLTYGSTLLLLFLHRSLATSCSSFDFAQRSEGECRGKSSDISNNFDTSSLLAISSEVNHGKRRVAKLQASSAEVSNPCASVKCEACATSPSRADWKRIDEGHDSAGVPGFAYTDKPFWGMKELMKDPDAPIQTTSSQKGSSGMFFASECAETYATRLPRDKDILVYCSRSRKKKRWLGLGDAHVCQSCSCIDMRLKKNTWDHMLLTLEYVSSPQGGCTNLVNEAVVAAAAYKRTAPDQFQKLSLEFMPSNPIAGCFCYTHAAAAAGFTKLTIFKSRVARTKKDWAAAWQDDSTFGLNCKRFEDSDVKEWSDKTESKMGEERWLYRSNWAFSK